MIEAQESITGTISSPTAINSVINNGVVIPTETDPTVPAHVKAITEEQIANWENGSNIDLSNYYTKADVDQKGYITEEQVDNKGFITSVPEETDPTVPEYVKNITEEQISNWDKGGNTDLTNYYTKEEIDNKGYITELPDTIATIDYVDAKTYTAEDITFSDGTTFQEKYNSGELKGEQGIQGPQGIQGLQGIQGPKGDTGAKGDKGDTGAQGPAGTNGTNGADGEDGFSPTISVSKSGSTTTITIKDVNGTKTATINDGADGEDGTNGTNGVSCTHSWSGTTLTITSASGTSSANLKGEKGDTGATGPQGEQGIQGEKGDKGDTGATGPAGADGKTPVKGTDYYTEEDKNEIIELVKNSTTSIETLEPEEGENYIYFFPNVLSKGLVDGTYFLTKTLKLATDSVSNTSGVSNNTTLFTFDTLVEIKEYIDANDSSIKSYDFIALNGNTFFITTENGVITEVMQSTLITKAYVDNLFNSIVNGNEVSY